LVDDDAQKLLSRPIDQAAFVQMASSVALTFGFGLRLFYRVQLQS
jgi:hypothetical protein